MNKIEPVKSGHLKVEFIAKPFFSTDTIVRYQDIIFYIDDSLYSNIIRLEDCDLECKFKDKIFYESNHKQKVYLKDSAKLADLKLAPFAYLYLTNGKHLNYYMSDTCTDELKYLGIIKENGIEYYKYHIDLKYDKVSLGGVLADKDDLEENKDSIKNRDEYIQLFINKDNNLLTRIKTRFELLEENQFNEINITVEDLYDEINKDIFDSINNTFQELYNKYILQEPDTFNPNMVEPIIEIAPDWKLPIVLGDSLSLYDIQSKLVLIDFWYISCLPCLRAIPELIAIDSLYNDRELKIIGINAYDKNPEKISNIIKKLCIEYDIVYMGKDVAKEYGVIGFPKLFLIDTKSKKIVYYHSGYSENIKDELKKEIDEYLMQEMK